MNHFNYAAKGPAGETLEGTIAATTRSEAVAELRRQNLVVLRLVVAPSAKRRGFKPSFNIGKPKIKARKGELVIFTRQLSTMVGAGLSLLESLDVLGDQAESPGMRLCCESLAGDVRAGSDLSAAMERCPRVFNHLYISMVKAGEISGQMDVILNRLADYQEASEELVREVKSAMAYPAISMVLVLCITGFLMIMIVPTFKDIFATMKGDLPGITQFVLGLSDYLRANVMHMFGVTAAVIASITVARRTPRGRYLFDRALLGLPIFGVLLKKVCLARFSRTFATLIRSGVPILSTLDIVANTSGNDVISRAVARSKESVRTGNLLSEPLSDGKVFPPMVVRMIAIGERTGALEALLEKIAEFYDSQVKAQVKALTSLIEPLLISLMGFIVGGVVLSIFFPILDMIGNVTGQ